MSHLSDYQLDAMRIGPTDVASMEHLVSCAACRARSDELAADARAWAAQHDVAALAEEAARVTPIRRRYAWVPALAAAAMAVLFLVPRADDTRIKGAGDVVEIFEVGGEPRAVRGPVDARASLAVRVSPRSAAYARVLWESAPGESDALYPPEDAPAWRVEAPAWLEQKIVLDGAPETETLVVVLCDEPFDHARAVSKPEDCEVHSVAVPKR